MSIQIADTTHWTKLASGSSVNAWLFGLPAILATVIYLNLPFIREYHRIAEPVLIAGVAVLMLASVATAVYKFKIGKFEIALLLVLAYLVVRSLAAGVSANNLLPPVLMVALFFTLKRMPGSWFHLSVAWPFCAIVFCYLAAIFYSWPDQTMNELLLPNKSILSILLGSQIAFVTPFAIAKGKRWHSFVLLMGLAICVWLVIQTGGRSGWIGCGVALGFIARRFGRINLRMLKLVPAGLILLVIMALSLFYFKEQSARGRLFIYKTSFSLFADNPVFGIGTGQFQVEYNRQQANYFSGGNIDGDEALLADNTYFAFNDVYQFTIENGFIGLLFALVALYFLIDSIKESLKHHNAPVLIGAVASLLCIGTASLFSYPFHLLPIIAQAAVCLAIISAYSVNDSQDGIHAHLYLPKSILVIIWIGILAYAVLLTRYRIQSREAFELSRAGYKKLALAKYDIIEGSSIKDGLTMFLHGRELYYSNQLQKAASVINRAKKYYSSNELYTVSGKIAEAQNLHSKAEKDFKTAVYMVPNRMLSRWELFNFYLRRRDTAGAVYWGRSIIQMPVKVPSATTSALQAKTAQSLDIIK